jgi:signal transduction histidine kinase
MDAFSTRAGRAARFALLVRRWPEHRRVVLGAAAGLWATALLLALGSRVALADLVLLIALAVALVALEVGAIGGLAMAAIGFAVVAVHAVARHVSLDPPEQVGIGVAVFSLAAVAGRFSDRMRGLQRRSERLLESGLRLAQPRGHGSLAASVADAVMLTARADGVLVCLDGKDPVSVGDATSRCLVIPLVAGEERIGRLEVFSASELAPEDQAALELVALQAGLARGNELAVVREGQRVRVESELRRARERLLEQRSELDHFVTSQEDERRYIARKLHEELAQVLAAVLMGLELVSRHASPDQSAAVADLRAQVVGALDELRRLADELTPPTLEQLGLVPALESLARETNERAEAKIVLRTGGFARALPPLAETVAYRVVREALEIARSATTTPSLRVWVGQRVRRSGSELRLTLELPDVSPEPALAGIRARIDLAGGAFESKTNPERGTRLRVALPLAADSQTATAARPSTSVV